MFEGKENEREMRVRVKSRPRYTGDEGDNDDESHARNLIASDPCFLVSFRWLASLRHPTISEFHIVRLNNSGTEHYVDLQVALITKLL